MTIIDVTRGGQPGKYNTETGQFTDSNGKPTAQYAPGSTSANGGTGINYTTNTTYNNGVPGGNGAFGAPVDPLQQAQLGYHSTAVDNAGYYGGLADLSRQVGDATGGQLQNNQNAIDAQGQNNADYYSTMLGLGGQLGTLGDNVNADEVGRLGGYQTSLAGLTDSNNAALSGLSGLYGQLATPLQSGVTWGGDLTSQAATAYADPAAIAAQNQALGQLQGTASGALDYQSQGAQAYADPQDIANQRQALTQLQDFSNGSGDVGISDLDPEAYAAQKSALQQFGALTTTQVTPQEQFIYEQARQAQEQDERANSAAALSNMRQRGVAGGAEELVSGALGGQQASQNRLLSDLGAQSNAIARSQNALTNYGGLATNMVGQANALAVGNSDRRLGATQSTGQLSTAMRNEGFTEAYDRGIAADKASSDNQQTRLSGQIASGNLASTQRQQSFTEAYDRGAAADQMAQYNRTQSIGVDEFNANYNQTERDDQWNRGLGMANTTLRTNEDNSINLGKSYDAGKAVDDDFYNRGKDKIDWNGKAATVNNVNNNAQTDRQMVADGTAIDAYNGLYNRGAGIVGGIVQNNQWAQGGVADTGAKIEGNIDAGKAAQDALALADKNHHAFEFLGLNIG